MPLDRRECLTLVAGGIAAGVGLSTSVAQAATSSKIKGIAFDAFPIFDPRPGFALAEQLFPGKGADLSSAWRTKQFEYQWLRALGGRYADFWQATKDALGFAATLLKLDLTPDKRKQLMDAYLGLQAWPEVPQALRALKSAGIRLALLSNATAQILNAGIKHSKLEGPIHDHNDRPDTVYILQGTITDHRNGVATDYGPGVGWPEDRKTNHWLENRGTIRAVEISVDIVRHE